MSRAGYPGCYCPITSWTDKNMFIAHWQAYHIDQHTSHIVCEHEKDGILCHYMTDRESDMKSHIHNLHQDAVAKKQARDSYVSENAWLDLTSSWWIKDLEMNFKTFPESRVGSIHTLSVWVIMDTKAEHPRTKNNGFRVPVYDSEEWATMKFLGTNTIKEMNTALAANAKTKAEPAKTKKVKTLRSCRIKSRELVESDSDSNDDSAIKAIQAVQKTKTISKDKSLLVPETLSGQVEYDARHHAKLSGVTDIQQSIVTSSPDAMTKFGQTQVQTKLSEYLEKVQTLATGSGNTSVSAAQVLKGFTILKKDPASNVQSTSKDDKSSKENDDEKAPAKFDNKGFKIPQGIAHQRKKKLDAEERRKIIILILARELESSGLLIDMVKIRQELKPYCLKENECRCYLIYLKNQE